MSSQKHPWEEITISDWTEFDELVAELSYNRWLFRGHSEASWNPDTSLYRAFEDARHIKKNAGKKQQFARKSHERFLIDRFKRSAHLYRSTLPKEDELLEWLAIMQHYGAPTRLLDVTLSPHIAVYFALEKGYGDSTVFAFHHARLAPTDSDPLDLRHRVFGKQNRSLDNSFIVPFSPRLTTERLLAQQGAFLVPSDIRHSFPDFIRKCPSDKAACKKFVIPAALRFDGIHRLRTMNLTSTALFPGIDGFCRSLKFQIFESVRAQGRIC